ncbi:MAG: zinc ribbon domain-containing protein [Pseudomonadota bacterium]|nr:zinc ribbon domain-containing protein [Pseudomonadota bacterium]
MTTAKRPEPVPNADSRPFWDAAREGILRAPKCRACGRISFPPKPACPTCRGTAFDWVDLSGRGTLKGWSRIHIAALPDRDPPITVVEVMLAEDARATLVALDDTGAVEGLAPDAPLVIGFIEDANGWSYPLVRPVGAEGV